MDAFTYVEERQKLQAIADPDERRKALSRLAWHRYVYLAKKRGIDLAKRLRDRYWSDPDYRERLLARKRSHRS